MQRLLLTADLLTGIDEIDDQHRGLYAWADRVLSEDPTGPPVLTRGAMAFLAGYVHYHFDAEEFAMELFEYPDRDAHKAQHKAFRREVDILRSVAGRMGILHEVRVRLHYLFRDLLRDHIQQVDRPMAAFLASVHRGPNLPALLPRPETLRSAGIEVAAEIDFDSIRVVPSPGEITPAELRSRNRLR